MALLVGRRSRELRHAHVARVERLDQALDRPALARRVPALEHAPPPAARCPRSPGSFPPSASRSRRSRVCRTSRRSASSLLRELQAEVELVEPAHSAATLPSLSSCAAPRRRLRANVEECARHARVAQAIEQPRLGLRAEDRDGDALAAGRLRSPLQLRDPRAPAPPGCPPGSASTRRRTRRTRSSTFAPDAAHEHRRVRLLHRLRPRPDRVEVHVLAVVLGLVLRSRSPSSPPRARA